jgi:hypothetical protein
VDPKSSDADPAWEMPASNGRTQFKCSARERSVDHRTVVASITLEGDFWQRDRPLKLAAFTREFSMTLPQVVLNLEALIGLAKMLEEWQVSKRSFEIELATKESRQQLLFRIGEDEGLICSADKPACTLSYHSGTMFDAKATFVVDQSCIRICSDTLNDFIGRVSTL